MISVKAYHKQEQNRRLRQLFSGKWTIQVRNPGMSRGCPFTSPGCFAEERETRLHRWIEPKTTDRDAAPHFIPAMLLNKLIEDVLQRDAV